MPAILQRGPAMSDCVERIHYDMFLVQLCAPDEAYVVTRMATSLLGFSIWNRLPTRCRQDCMATRGVGERHNR